MLLKKLEMLSKKSLSMQLEVPVQGFCWWTGGRR